MFEEAWLQKLRSDLGAFLSAGALGRHAPALRHLAGDFVVARGPQTAPPPASWHELVRIADLGLAAASQLARRAAAGRRLREVHSPASPGRRPGWRPSTPLVHRSGDEVYTCPPPLARFILGPGAAHVPPWLGQEGV